MFIRVIQMRILRVWFLVALSLAALVSRSSAVKVTLKTASSLRALGAGAIAASLALGTAPFEPFEVAPVHAAQLYGGMKADDIPGASGNGGIDAFISASNAMKVEKQSALKDTDFQKVQRGEMKPSEEPRAVKRRVLKACTDGKLIKEAKVSSRECTQRVMAGELDFMLQVMKE